jgi:HlyD family secretion protein
MAVCEPQGIRPFWCLWQQAWLEPAEKAQAISEQPVRMVSSAAVMSTASAERIVKFGVLFRPKVTGKPYYRRLHSEIQAVAAAAGGCGPAMEPGPPLVKIRIGVSILKKWLLLAAVAVAVGAIVWAVVRKSRPPLVDFARVKRQTLVSTLPTNGKVEPYEWQSVRAETGGLVDSVPVHVGETVAKGAIVARLSDPSLAAEMETAESRVAEARATLTQLELGGRSSDRAEIENSLAQAQLNLQAEQKEAAALERLEQKQAATRMEVQAAQQKVQASEAEIAGLEKRRGALVARTDITAAQARLADAEAALALARKRAAWSVVRSPLAGEVYGQLVHPGDYLEPGGLVANVGRLDRVRVRVYVDEPLLGRVQPGDPVTITWEALPDKKWHGTVQQMPSSIETLGSRQVGEVVCTIENPGRELIPGTNVDAAIRTAVAENTLVIPKEALRHDVSGDFVFVLRGDRVGRQPVTTGISTVNQVQVTGGLAEGDTVALPTDVPLANGTRVTPVM